jgi:alpha-2-macroglobulin
MDYHNFIASDLYTCQRACINDTNCKAYTFNTYQYRCWLKQGIPPQTYGSGLISGIKTCVTPQTPIP